MWARRPGSESNHILQRAYAVSLAPSNTHYSIHKKTTCKHVQQQRKPAPAENKHGCNVPSDADVVEMMPVNHPCHKHRFNINNTLAKIACFALNWFNRVDSVTCATDILVGCCCSWMLCNTSVCRPCPDAAQTHTRAHYFNLCMCI